MLTHVQERGDQRGQLGSLDVLCGSQRIEKQQKRNTVTTAKNNHAAWLEETELEL